MGKSIGKSGNRKNHTKEDPTATLISKNSTPLRAERFSCILIPAMARIGTSKTAVAVLLRNIRKTTVTIIKPDRT